MANKEIEDLETFFNGVRLPEHIELGPGEKIMNVPLFIGSHLAAVKHNTAPSIYVPFMDRLIKLKELLSAPDQESTGKP